MRRARFACIALVLLALELPASAQIVVYHEDFESGFGQWTMTGMWNAETSTDACGGQLPTFASGTQCAYFGNDTVCNYELGTASHRGELTWTSALTIPATGHVTLRFWDWRDAECFNDSWPPITTGWDKTHVQVSINGGMTWTTIGQPCETRPLTPYALNSAWHPHVLNLAAYQGQQIHLRFLFDTVDGNWNDLFGWAIDDVSILIDSSSTNCFVSFQSCPCTQLMTFQPWVFPLIACQNSTQMIGELLATGSPIVSQDSLTLQVRHLPPNSPVLFFQGSTLSAGAAFGDGRLCLNGPFDRLAVVFATNGEAVYPAVGQPGIASVGGIPVTGGTRSYQAYYRNSVSFCTSATFNVSSAFETVWSP